MSRYKNMGIGDLGRPELIFVRQFRFIVKGEHLSEMFNYSAHINWTKKIIRLGIYEVMTPEGVLAHNWADAMERGEYPDETLALETLDGCGHELYKRRFTGLKIVNRENSFNYSNSDVSIHTIDISYEECHNVPVEKKESTAEAKQSEPQPTEAPYDLAPVDHLNARIWTK